MADRPEMFGPTRGFLGMADSIIQLTDLSSDVFAILTSFSPDDKNTKFIAILQIVSKTSKQWHNKGITELYCLFTTAGIIVDAVGFIRQLFCDPKTSCAQIHLWSDLSS